LGGGIGRGGGRGVGKVGLRIGSSDASSCVQVNCGGGTRCKIELEAIARLRASMRRSADVRDHL
jgi:hypothetical protein